jgi:hypothetical protein
MLPNSNLSKEDAQWLINEYPKVIGRRVDRGTIHEHLKAFNLIKGASATIPSCSCQWVSASKVSESLFSQHKTEIESIANVQ